MDPIPFFVVDRPMSLKILQFCEVDKQAGTYGLMAHALTTKNFQKQFREFPGDNIVKAADSGVFSKNGCHLSYQELYDTYERMNVSYGIMIDYLKDWKKTVESAKEAQKIYAEKTFSFDLVGVAQGKTEDEYVKCYDELKSIGFDHIAIGGLLKKKVNTARYVHVRNKQFLENVVKMIREEYPSDWLFLLGCYSPNRHQLFKKYDVFGGDYKGWIFNYKTPEEMNNNVHSQLAEEEKHFSDQTLKKLNKKREGLIENLQKNRQDTEKRKKIQEKISSLDKRILKKRLQTMRWHDKSYRDNVRLLNNIKHMSREEKRLYRFKQIRSYLEKHIYSLFRNRLLLISCSKKKNELEMPSFALDVYDGPYYKTLKKLRRENKFPKDMHTLVLSAKYGLLDLYDMIQTYDQVMTPKRAEELTEDINKDLHDFLKNHAMNEIYISMGKNYEKTIDIFLNDGNVRKAEGAIGKKLQKTKFWMNQN